MHKRAEISKGWQIPCTSASPGKRCQFDFTGGDGGAGQIGHLPVFAHDQIVTIQGHDGGTLEAVLAVQNPDHSVVGNVRSGGLGFRVVDDQVYSFLSL